VAPLPANVFTPLPEPEPLLEPWPQPEPSPHGTHVVAVVALVACENVSAAQSTHAEDPVEFLNVPAGQ